MAEFGEVKTEGQMQYAAYLRSAAWSKRKSRYAATHFKLCAVCGSDKRCDLHHKTYVNMHRDGTEPDADLCWLCRRDHELVHRAADVGNFSIDTAVAALSEIFSPLPIVKQADWQRRRTRKEKLAGAMSLLAVLSESSLGDPREEFISGGKK